MDRFRKFLKYLLLASLILLVVFLLLAGWSFKKVPVKEPKNFGITYSAKFVEKFGMDRKEVFLAILDNFKVKYLRIPIYWDETEKEDDIYSLEEIDWQLTQAQDRGVKVIVAVGRKLFRWPECHEPEWVQNEKLKIKSEKLLDHLEAVVNRYKEHSALDSWQVENEPFLRFGKDCPLLGGEFLDKEIALIRRLDPGRPIIVTDSGELSFWIRAARRADIFGTTMYRTIWNENLGYFTYPLPPGFFRAKRAFMELFVGTKPMFVSELQLEPWGPHQLYEIELFNLEEQLAHFNVDTFKEHIEYAKKSGFDEFYLWGAEWWYYLKINGHPEIWNEAKKLF